MYLTTEKNGQSKIKEQCHWFCEQARNIQDASSQGYRKQPAHRIFLQVKETEDDADGQMREQDCCEGGYEHEEYFCREVHTKNSHDKPPFLLLFVLVLEIRSGSENIKEGIIEDGRAFIFIVGVQVLDALVIFIRWGPWPVWIGRDAGHHDFI